MSTSKQSKYRKEKTKIIIQPARKSPYNFFGLFLSCLLSILTYKFIVILFSPFYTK